MGETEQAAESFHKALILDPDNVPATIHLAHLFLSPVTEQDLAQLAKIAAESDVDAAEKAEDDDASESLTTLKEAIDMTVGMLESFTRRTVGYNVPETWYFLGKATGMQGRKERQRECLREALRLDEGRPVRCLGAALPHCL